jgi:3-oxoacyl-[acyl-carrier-protein] synthase III
MGSRIVATGRATPRTTITNHDLERRMDTSDEWIRTRTGIVQRQIICSGESLVDIAAEASRTALARAGMKPADLDAIVVVTVSSDYGFPSFGMPSATQEATKALEAYILAQEAGIAAALPGSPLMSIDSTMARVLEEHSFAAPFSFRSFTGSGLSMRKRLSQVAMP